MTNLPKPKPAKQGEKRWQIQHALRATTADLIKELPPRLRAKYKRVLI